MSRTAITVGTWLLAVLLFSQVERGLTFAQDHAPPPPIGCAFDSYGNIRSCDQSARLDNFAIQIQNTPEGYGYVIVYAPESASKLIRQNIVDYLVNTRGILGNQIKTIHGGYNQPITEPWVQLWIVPKGAKPPKPTKFEVNLATIKGMFAEFEDWDNIQLVGPAFEAEDVVIDSSPPVGNVTFAAFEDVMKAQKNSVAHVIGFNGPDAVPGAWRRGAESTVEDLKRFGFDSSRFKIGYGGQAKETRVQIWILPKGETPPLKDPATEPPPAKAVQIGEFDDGTLGYAKNEAAVFDRLLKVIQQNPDLRTCFIVRMPGPATEEEITEPAEEIAEPIESTPEEEPVAPTAPKEPEPEPADLPKLVEKWKNELAAKHKLRPDRLVVLFANGESYRTPSIEIWLVPPGQPLPDPNAPEPNEEEPPQTLLRMLAAVR